MLYLLEWAITLQHVFVLSNTNNRFNTCRLKSTWEADRPPALLFPGGNSYWLHPFMRHSYDAVLSFLVVLAPCEGNGFLQSGLLWEVWVFETFCEQGRLCRFVDLLTKHHPWVLKPKCLASWSHTFIPGWSPTACAVFWLTYCFRNV